MSEQQLPPASTTNYSTRGFADALARKASRKAPPVRETMLEEPEAVQEARAREQAPQPSQESAPEAQRPYRLSELSAMLTGAQERRRAVVEARDLDGPDVSGYDAAEIVKTAGGASIAAAALRRRK